MTEDEAISLTQELENASLMYTAEIGEKPHVFHLCNTHMIEVIKARGLIGEAIRKGRRKNSLHSTPLANVVGDEHCLICNYQEVK